MQRLGPSESRSQCLVSGANNVVVRLLRSRSNQRSGCGIASSHDAGRVAPTRSRISRAQRRRAAKLGHLLEQVVVGVPEEREAWREVIDLEPACRLHRRRRARC